MKYLKKQSNELLSVNFQKSRCEIYLKNYFSLEWATPKSMYKI